MSYYDKNFINTFNEYYPFEKLIIKEPKQINYLFDDVLLTEIFILEVAKVVPKSWERYFVG